MVNLTQMTYLNLEGMGGCFYILEMSCEQLEKILI